MVQKSKLKHKIYSEVLKKWDAQVIEWDTQISEESVSLYFIFTLRKETIALPEKIVIM